MNVGEFLSCDATKCPESTTQHTVRQNYVRFCTEFRKGKMLSKGFMSDVEL